MTLSSYELLCVRWKDRTLQVVIGAQLQIRLKPSRMWLLDLALEVDVADARISEPYSIKFYSGNSAIAMTEQWHEYNVLGD